jgi:hypothetical protein
MQKAYDIFYTKPGSSEDINCTVCGTKCSVERNVYGPSSWITAWGKKYSYHDIFTCPHTGKEWHEQALKLILAIEETPSKRVAELMEIDLRDLLKENAIITGSPS